MVGIGSEIIRVLIGSSTGSVLGTSDSVGLLMIGVGLIMVLVGLEIKIGLRVILVLVDDGGGGIIVALEMKLYLKSVKSSPTSLTHCLKS